MPIGINMPDDKSGDGIGDIMKAVQIATSLYGMKLDKDKMDLLKKNADLESAEAARKQAGVKTAGEFQGMLAEGGLELPQDAKREGAIRLPVQSESGIQEKNFLPAPFVKQDLMAKREDIERNRKLAEVAKSEKKAASQEEFKRTDTLSKDYSRLSKDTMQALSGYKKVKTAAENPNPTGATDLALIFGFMKTVDPGSTVREGEFANAQNAQGVDDKIVSLYNQVKEGQRLTPESRQNFIVEAERAMQQQLSTQKATDDRFLEASQKFGVDPKFVINPEFQKYYEQLGSKPSVTNNLSDAGHKPGMFEAVAAPDENTRIVNGVKWVRIPGGKWQEAD